MAACQVGRRRAATPNSIEPAALRVVGTASSAMSPARAVRSSAHQANAVVAWTTEYYGLAVESMRRTGRRIDDEVLAHISPAHSENINFLRLHRR